MHTSPGRRFAAVQARSDLVILELGDHPELNRVTLDARHVAHRRREGSPHVILVTERLDSGRGLGVELGSLKAKSPDGSHLHGLVAEVVRELLGCDPIQPSAAGSAEIPESAAPLEGDSERLSQ